MSLLRSATFKQEFDQNRPRNLDHTTLNPVYCSGKKNLLSVSMQRESTMDDIKAAFLKYDADRSGFITSDEAFRVLQVRFGLQGPGPEQ